LNRTKGEFHPKKIEWHGVWVLENTSKTKGCISKNMNKTKGNLGLNKIKQNERGFKKYKLHKRCCVEFLIRAQCNNMNTMSSSCKDTM